MEKQKRWHFYLILGVIVLTLINIFPTLFYYAKPLKSPVGKSIAMGTGEAIAERVNDLELDAKAWLVSFCQLLEVKPLAIELDSEDSGYVHVRFKNPHDAALFRRLLPRAGALIPFVPAQLTVALQVDENQTDVLVKRQVHTHFNKEDLERYFHFYAKESEGVPTLEYRQSVNDRAAVLITELAGPSRMVRKISRVLQESNQQERQALTLAIAREIVTVHEVFDSYPNILKRYQRYLVQAPQGRGQGLLQEFIGRLAAAKQAVQTAVALGKPAEGFGAETSFGIAKNTEEEIAVLEKAGTLLKQLSDNSQLNVEPLGYEEIMQRLKENDLLQNKKQTVPIARYHPLFESVVIDWMNDTLVLNFHPDVEAILEQTNRLEDEAFVKDQLSSYVYETVAYLSREADEEMTFTGNAFSLNLTHLPNAQSFLALDLAALAKKRSEQVLQRLLTDWHPTHSDLNRDQYPIIGYELYQKLPIHEQRLGLVVYAPVEDGGVHPKGFRPTSIYVIAKGLDAIIQKYRENPSAPGATALAEEIEQLSKLMRGMGFLAYSGSSYGIDEAFAQDYIFELDDFYSVVLNATREDFYVKGSKRYAVLDFTDVEQRLVTTNAVEDRMQEELIKWGDDYNAAQVDMNVSRRFSVPAPTKNVYWENLKLSLAKYFRGDDRKILRWGLDLSGGKTVRIGLVDQNNRPVTNPEDLKQAVNELYTRVNKMGVAERTIRIENNNIILDFPGSQALSASELVKASAMYFHIVNEKFSTLNPTLRESVDQFLQNVWNEAVVTNRKDPESINQIAWEHLGSDGETLPRNAYAKILLENGLQLAAPEQGKTVAFNDTLSMIAVMKGDDFSEWDGQSHPLLVVFNNYALEGASLTNVQVGYDPSKGNTLHFGVKSAYERVQRSGVGSPREDFYTWTSQFAEEKIGGTPKEMYSQGRGWRMAVILNQAVITKPQLHGALRDSGEISGRFTQREITQLAADLKAGSLSFTPKILSEQNVSAELGYQDRTKGIFASLIGLVLVAVAMIGYYRFAGVVATCAVLFNLLIMWGVLQNLGAALTLPGIAGIVLTIGMAVDANVLVFERIREEFAVSGRISSAIQEGYRKAFSAIIDSNVTTIIAALILIQFDSGPIKGFAVTLIIGLVSSLFTALFMTRYFFLGWMKKAKNQTLSMAKMIGGTTINFLGYAKQAIALSLIVMVIGGYFFISQRHTLFGMDFTGGYSLNVELEETLAEAQSYKEVATQALLNTGATANDFEIRELTHPNQLRIHLSLGMEEEGHPFYGMPEYSADDTVLYEYEKDPRLTWVVNTLGEGGLVIGASQLEDLDQSWSMMSGQFSSSMTDNALKALGLALLSILVYITFRFEFKFAISAVIALAHDVVATLGIFAVLHYFGLPVQIDLEVVGAIMTIIGYSLNDTIVVFDRIREDTHVLRKLSFKEIINHALNVTLSRTLMTSGTTLLVLLSLVILGGKSILDFSLVMTIGVIVGTFSSLFIASPVMLFFHRYEANGSERTVAMKRT